MEKRININVIIEKEMDKKIRGLINRRIGLENRSDVIRYILNEKFCKSEEVER